LASSFHPNKWGEISGKTCKMSGKNLSFERKISGKVYLAYPARLDKNRVYVN